MSIHNNHQAMTSPTGDTPEFSGDRGRTPKAAGAVRELINSTPAPGDFWGDINPCPTPRLTDDCEQEIFCFRVGRPRDREEETTHLVSSASRIQKLTYNIWESIGSGIRRMEDNTAEFLRAEEETGELAHDCVEVIEQVYWELFTDGSSFVENGTRYAGYAVVTLQQVIEAKVLPPGTSAQKAEVWALTRALILSQGKRVNIWTDSKYAFGVVHVHGALWKERGLLNSQGSLIKHREEVKALLEAIHKPQAVAVMHVRGHRNEEGKAFQGNQFADRTVKQAAREVWT
ncbi:uncharacterized protein [Sylvia atricapilla]|uniref:uncharacterized protein n=1 Tax=Sylvia atricapilla TaxID=48155 RepID=UPI003399B017